MSHRLVVGYTGDSVAYLDLSCEEAVKRYEAKYPGRKISNMISEFEFEDEFWTYDSGPSEK